MVTGTKAEQADNEIDLPQYYLVNGYVKDDGTIVDGSVLPINNTVIALSDEGNKFIVKTEKDDSKNANNVKVHAESLQIYMTDSVGRICNFDAGSQLKADENKIDAKPLETAGYLKAISDQAKLYFPPKRSVLYHMASSGYDNWAATLRKLLNTFVNTASGNAYVELKDQISAKRSLSVAVKFSLPENVNDNAYSTWYEAHKLHHVPIIFIPRVKAVVVAFSSSVYKGSTITIRNHLGELCFIGNDSVNDEKHSATVQETFDGKGYCATFYAGENDYAIGESIYQQVYRIEVELGGDGFDAIGIERYAIAEKFRFDISNIAGDFQIINGDAISLEESMIKQFPLLYNNLREASFHVPAADKAALAPYLHGASLITNNAKAASEILGAASGQEATKKIGSYIVSNIDVVGKAVYGGVSAKEVIDMAFALHDADVAGDIEKLTVIAPEIMQGAEEAADKIFAAVKNKDFVKSIEERARLSGKNVSAAWRKVAHKLNTDPKLKQIRLSRSTQKWLDIKKYKLKKIRKTLDKNNVAGKIGLISGGFGFASATAGYWQADTNGDNAVKNLSSVAYQYSHYLNQLDADNETPNKKNKEKEDSITQAVNKYKQYFGDKADVKVNGESISINISFPFDRHSFDSDTYQSDVAEFVNATNAIGKDCSVVLVGHTCDLGDDDYNLALSIRRATTVKKSMENAKSNFHISVEGRGKTGKSEGLTREQQRRVEAVIHTTFSRRYFPSREGMDSLERFRSLSVLFYREENEQIKAAMKAAIELVLCAPHPATAAAGVLWAAGSLLMDAGALLDKLVSGSEFVKIINDHDSKGIESADNLILMTAGLSNPDVRSRYLQSQFRLRAETLYGLVRLLMRCSVEVGDGQYDAWRSGTKTKRRSDLSFATNLEYYRVDDYIKTFVLRDGWQLPAGLTLPIGIEQHWIQLIEDDILDAVLESPDSSIYEKIDAGLEKLTGFDVTDLVAGINPVTRLSLLNDLYSATSKSALFSPLQGFDYIRFSMSDNYKSHKDDVLTAQYQSFFPVHYQAAENLESFAAKFKTNFAGLNKSAFAYCGIFARDSSSNTTPESGWVPLDIWLKGRKSLSPMHQIRICVFLNPTDETVKSLIKEGSIGYVPVECAPIRRDGLNIPGPAVKGFISKIAEGQLSAAEKKVIKVLTDDSLLAKDEPLYGAILNPFYMFGITRINGTRPMAGEVSSWLNVDTKGEIEDLNSYWNFDGTWDMRYAYEVMLANKKDCIKPVTYINDEDEFPLSIDVDRVHSIDGSKGSHSERKLLNKYFLQAGKNREVHPPLFVDPKVYCLLRNAKSGDFFESNKILSDHRSHGFNRELLKDDFRWDKPLEIVVLLVSENLKTHDYPRMRLSWKNVPMVLEVGKVSGSNYQAGSKHKSTFQYLGKLEGEGIAANFIKDEGAKDLDSGLEKMVGYLKDSSVVNGYSDGKSCHVHAVHIALDYQALTGERKQGLRPFLINPEAIPGEHFWAFGFKITTAGDSGLKGLRSEDSYQFNGPTGFTDPNSHWYPKPGHDYLVRYKSVMDKIENDINDGKINQSYDPSVVLSHWAVWDKLLKKGESWWDDDWSDLVTEWAHDKNGSRELKGSAPLLR
jgi:outer membrane protein OmpA-like peptidoglycan-associated protein